MRVREIVQALNARVLAGEEFLDREVKSACGADLMSDVLAFVKDKTVLLTGLTNTHAVRTADMLDMSCIVFVRGKQPDAEILDMATERELPVLTTEYTLYVACGELYKLGLPGGGGKA